MITTKMPNRQTAYHISEYITREEVINTMLPCYDCPKEYKYINEEFIITEAMMEEIADKIFSVLREDEDASLKDAIRSVCIDYFPPPEFDCGIDENDVDENGLDKEEI